MRALLRPLSLHTVFSPIETIVFVFVLATLAYFHILDGIKHSSFFAPTFPSTLKPAYARLSGSEWIATNEREWYTAAKRGQDQAVELQQIVFGLDEKARKVSVVAVALSLLCRVGAASAQPRLLRPITRMGVHHINVTHPRRVLLQSRIDELQSGVANTHTVLQDTVTQRHDGRVGPVMTPCDVTSFIEGWEAKSRASWPRPFARISVNVPCANSFLLIGHPRYLFAIARRRASH